MIIGKLLFFKLIYPESLDLVTHPCCRDFLIGQTNPCLWP